MGFHRELAVKVAVSHRDGGTRSERVGLKHQRKTAMEWFIGIDVSLEQSSVCVLDAGGKIMREAKIASEPEALVAFCRELELPVTRIGLEAGPLSQWLHAGLTSAGFETVLLETRQVKAALSAMVVKTDRKDARGIAHLLRMGWYRPVHCKSVPTQEVRALLAGRKLLLGKLRDVELSIRGLLRGFGLKVGEVSKGRLEARIRELIAGHPMLEQVIQPLLRAREVLNQQYHVLHRAMLNLVRHDAVCRRLMTVPGVGPVVALTFRATLDVPARFRNSRAVGAALGLTPGKYQSGESDHTGGISRCGDEMMRVMLYEAAHIMLVRLAKWSWLKAWAMKIARHRGMKKAIVALARRLAVIMHRIWVDGTEFRWTREVTAA